MKKAVFSMIALTIVFAAILLGILIGRATAIRDWLPLPGPDEIRSDRETTAPVGKIDINQADIETLMLLPGIGEKTAKKIVQERTQNGPFLNPEDILRVEGIGEKKLADMKDYIITGG